MNINELIASNRVKDAIQILIDANVPDSILLMSRFNSLERERMLGVLGYEQETRQRNQIVTACLDYAKRHNVGYSVPAQTSTIAVFQSDFNEAALLEIISTNKRRRSEIAEEAQAILTDYRAWKDEKQTKPSFDPAGRRLRQIQASADALTKRLADEKEASLEKIVARIEELLLVAVPEYSALKEAYDLAAGRGYKSAWVEQQLENQPTDNEVRISIAEKIEAFTANIVVR